MRPISRALSRVVDPGGSTSDSGPRAALSARASSATARNVADCRDARMIVDDLASSCVEVCHREPIDFGWESAVS
jgi:hypothetical protein